MELHIYNNKTTFDQVIDRLKILGDVEYVTFDWNSDVGRKARDLFESEKFTKETNDESGFGKLSETDCYLLELAIAESLVLVTGDLLLARATAGEARDRNPSTKTFNPYESH